MFLGRKGANCGANLRKKADVVVAVLKTTSLYCRLSTATWSVENSNTPPNSTCPIDKVSRRPKAMQVEVEQGPCTIPPCQRGVLGPPFRAVVFDLDGTLLDTEALSDEAMLRALAHILKSLLYSDFVNSKCTALQ